MAESEGAICCGFERHAVFVRAALGHGAMKGPQAVRNDATVGQLSRPAVEAMQYGFCPVWRKLEHHATIVACALRACCAVRLPALSWISPAAGLQPSVPPAKE